MSDNNQNIPKYSGGRMSLEDTVRHAEYVRKEYGKKRNGKLRKLLDDGNNGAASAPLNKGDGGNDTPSAGAETIVVKRKRKQSADYNFT
jgi:hypothetical protein